MNTWKFFTPSHLPNRTLAYQVQGNIVRFTAQVGYDQNGQPEVFIDDDDDFYISQIELNPDGTLSFHDWIELRQFNCCNMLIAELHLLNHVQSEMFQKSLLDLNPQASLRLPVFRATVHEQPVLDLGMKAVLKIGEVKIEQKTSFIKYTFLTNTEKVCWTLPLLFDFTVQLQKFLQRMEQKAGGTMFLQTDQEIQEL